MRWLLWMALLGAPMVTSTTAQAGAALVEETDRLGASVVPEAEAVHVLLQAIAAGVADGSVHLSADAASRLAEVGPKLDAARAAALDRQYGAAIKAMRELRPGVRAALAEVFAARPPAPVSDALRGYIEVMVPRIAAIEHQIENYPLTEDGRMYQHLGTAHLDEAGKLAKKKDWDGAFRALMSGLGELDRTIVECYPTAR